VLYLIDQKSCLLLNLAKLKKKNLSETIAHVFFQRGKIKSSFIQMSPVGLPTILYLIIIIFILFKSEQKAPIKEQDGKVRITNSYYIVCLPENNTHHFISDSLDCMQLNKICK
jgi:hypothetical protein